MGYLEVEELKSIGLLENQEILKIIKNDVNRWARKENMDAQIMLPKLWELIKKPKDFLDDEVLGRIAQNVSVLQMTSLESSLWQDDTIPEDRAPAPWVQFGDVDLDLLAVAQMEKACRLPVALRGALMPDAHLGYGLPIGGVLAVRKAVIPYAVGVDIACRMRITVLDRPFEDLFSKRDEFLLALENETRFGVGSGFEMASRRRHDVMDDNDWSETKITHSLKDKAAKQLGSSGGGNHFVEFGELLIKEKFEGLLPGSYLAFLSHSGSRGTGEEVATHYSKLAMKIRPFVHQKFKNLAWLDIDSQEGQEYWKAMNLMGRYAAANHQSIHKYVLKALGAESLLSLENHHNFAWEEMVEGEKVIVHRKGATPASLGTYGIVPGSMGDPGYIVRGKGDLSSLSSCSHGAGRKMSRSAAFKSISREEMEEYLSERGVSLISADLDEAPMVYKDIRQVMAAQSSLVDIMGEFFPRLVKMAPPENCDRKNRWLKKKKNFLKPNLIEG